MLNKKYMIVCFMLGFLMQFTVPITGLTATDDVVENGSEATATDVVENEAEARTELPTKSKKKGIAKNAVTVGRLVAGANPVGIVLGRAGLFGAQKLNKKLKACTNNVEICCLENEGICKVKDDNIVCCDKTISTDCKCNN